MGADRPGRGPALEGRAESGEWSTARNAPLRDGEAPGRAAIVTTKTPEPGWAAEQAARVLAPDGVALTIQKRARQSRDPRLSFSVDHAGASVVFYVRRGRSARTDRTTRPVPAGSNSRDHPGASLRRVSTRCRAAPCGKREVEVVGDPWPCVWRKLIANAVINAPSAIFDATLRRTSPGDPADVRSSVPLRESPRRRARGFPSSERDAIVRVRAIAPRDARASLVNATPTCGAGQRLRSTHQRALVREARAARDAAPLNQSMTIIVSALHPRATANG